jgi:hypothetical protein
VWAHRPERQACIDVMLGRESIALGTWERAGMQRQDAIAPHSDDTTSCPTSATTFEPSTPPRRPLPCLLALRQPITSSTPRLLAASAPGESSHGTLRRSSQALHQHPF